MIERYLSTKNVVPIRSFVCFFLLSNEKKKKNKTKRTIKGVWMTNALSSHLDLALVASLSLLF
jgi:hypothetical protein